MNAARKPTQPKIQFYKDRKYILVKFDRLNYAILRATKSKTTKTEDQPTLGYFPTLIAGLEEIIRLRAEDQLLLQVQELGPFTSLDTLVMKYTESVLTATHEVVSLVKQHTSTLAELDS